MNALLFTLNFDVKLTKFYLTIRLQARDFYEGFALINHHRIEIESE